MKFNQRAQARQDSNKAPTGIAGVEEITRGGLPHARTILLVGSLGSGKNTLSGPFAKVACGRGEHTLFVNFDSDCNEVIRNLASLGIGLELRVKSFRTEFLAKHAKKALLVRATQSHKGELSSRHSEIKALPGDNETIADRKAGPP